MAVERIGLHAVPIDSLSSKLHDATKILMAELSWEGCDGLTVTDEMRATIAGNAAVMLLGIDEYYFDSVPSVLLFPEVMQRDRQGVRKRHVGEAKQFGPLAFSWPDVLRDSEKLDGSNVVIHEFAHHLDGLDGEMGGSLPFANEEQLQNWHDVSQREFASLVAAVDAGRATFLNPYGAKNQAEFFAVCSESFFELPTELKAHHREVYQLLCEFYRIDPSSWS